MFCTPCGKKSTNNKTKNRTINPITKICNECEISNGNTTTGYGGARRKDSVPDTGAIVNDESTENYAIPEDIAHKSVAEISATEIYTIVTTAMQVTNRKIDDLQNDVQNKIGTLENKVKILETENEKKDDDINLLKHTVISMQKAMNSIDQNERSTKAVIQHLPETDMEGPEGGMKLTSDSEKIHQICKFMNYNMDIEAIERLDVSRIGKQREGFSRMIKIVFPNSNERDAFVKSSSKMKEAPEHWKKVYIKKDQHPVYVAENNRLRKKMNDLRKVPENKEKEVLIKDGKLMINGITVDQNLFFH